MPAKTWKNFERKIAELLGGARIPCSGNARIKGDVLHEIFFIECKYGEQIPKRITDWYKKAKEQADGKITLLCMKPKGMHIDFILISVEDFIKILRDGHGNK